MITRETILDLNKKAEDVSISIYIPTHKSEPEAGQDSIRFKNALSEIEQSLKSKDMRLKDIDALLEEPRKLLDSLEFWKHADHGLAVFITQDYFETVRLPYQVSERYLIDDHFLITPLIRMITHEGTFQVLALSQKNLRLLKCTRHSVEEIELEDIPKSMEEFQQYDVYQKSIQHHSGQGKGNAIFHGHGGGEDERSVLEEYLKTVENAVTASLRKQNDPLILIGVESVVAHYRKVNHYHRVLDNAVIKNPDPLKNKELGSLSWEVIEIHFLSEMNTSLEALKNVSGNAKVSSDLKEIVQSAHFGKVEALFLEAESTTTWGVFNPDQNVFDQFGIASNTGQDLVNLMAIKTLEQGGKVYSLQKEHLPIETNVAAIYRFA